MSSFLFALTRIVPNFNLATLSSMPTKAEHAVVEVLKRSQGDSLDDGSREDGEEK